MQIIQIYTDNKLRNYNYIIACSRTSEAVVIDPLRVDLILQYTQQNNYKITKIINTHEHADHTDGNQALVDETNAEVYCHHLAVNKIPCAQHGLKKDDLLKIGSTVELKVLDTPGHTMAHVCLLATNKENNDQAIFSGDTLFNAGTGHVRDGNMDDLYNTFVNILYKLSPDTRVYPGHDYLENNLNFTLSREPNNAYVRDLLSKIKNHDPHNSLVTTLAIEQQINTFFRLDNKEIINQLKTDVNSFPLTPTAKQVFVALRELRNEW